MILNDQYQPLRYSLEDKISAFILLSTEKTIRFMGVSLWNSVSNVLNINCSVVTFKQTVEKYLLTN